MMESGMHDLILGQKAPAFSCPSVTGKEIGITQSSSLSGEAYILYFYPKALTPGCIKQACHVRDNLPALREAFAGFSKVRAFGVSPDPVKKLAEFIAREELNFTLLSDEAHHLSEAYGVWKEKKLYGRSYMGIERSSFLIDAQGVLRSMKRNIRPDEQAIWMEKALGDLSGSCAGNSS